jgi:hypothetical protein
VACSRYLVQARLDERKSQREFERDHAAATRERERDEQAAARERERDEQAAAREQEREEAALAEDLLVATRLVLDELDTIALHHAMFASQGYYPDKLSPRA